MLELKVHDGDREVVLQFEHSLLSLSKWESKHKVPFMIDRQKTNEEMLDYFVDMLLSPDVDSNLVYGLSPNQMDRIINYINTPQTASSVPPDVKTLYNSETITSELIYYWLSALRVSFQPTETWHISRIMMLVQIAGYKQQPAKKRNPKEVMTDWIRINEERKKKFGTRG